MQDLCFGIGSWRHVSRNSERKVVNICHLSVFFAMCLENGMLIIAAIIMNLLRYISCRYFHLFFLLKTFSYLDRIRLKVLYCKLLLYFLSPSFVLTQYFNSVEYKWYFQTELFNIPDWDCPDTVKAPFYEGLERNEHSISTILWLGVGFLGNQA